MSETEGHAGHTPADRPHKMPAHGGIGEIVRRFGPTLRSEYARTSRVSQVLGHIALCRTAALGGHLHVCGRCGHETPVYNGCRDRHCAGCQSTDQYRWLFKRRERNPPTTWFHVVFTLPEPIRTLARLDPTRIYTLLFESARDTLLTLAEDPDRLGATPAITAVLHTWTRELHLHPHVHCIVSAGGLSPDDTRWIAIERPYLFPTAVMATLFRGKLVGALDRLDRSAPLRMPDGDPGYFQRVRESLYTTRWVVYAKAPFGDGDSLFRYLGRYTHRVGISNARIREITDTEVSFATKDGKEVTVPGATFLRRFVQHVLPVGFTRIRHFGLFASSNVHTRLERSRSLLAATASECVHAALPAHDHWATLLHAMTGFDPMRCPQCHQGNCDRRPLPSPQSAITHKPDTS